MTEGLNEKKIELPSGSYSVTVNAALDSGEKIVWQEIAHIYDNAITKAVEKFMGDDFKDASAKITNFDMKGIDDYVCFDDRDPANIKIIVHVPPSSDMKTLTPHHRI